MFELLQDGINSTRVIVESRHDILLLKRAPSGEFQGSWELPGGKIEPPESPAEAALREAGEETGLEMELLDLAPDLVEDRTIQDGKHMGKIYRACGFVAAASSRDFRLSDEHIAGVWLKPRDALKVKNLALPSRQILNASGPLLNGWFK